MGWIEGLNASVDYIEEHLDGDVDIARAASFASCTEGQFRRLFSYLAGMGAGGVRAQAPFVVRRARSV